MKKYIDGKKDKKKKKKFIDEEEEKNSDNPGTTGGSNFEPKVEPDGKEESFGGDLSSICIAPLEQDQIQFNDFLADADDSVALPK